MPEVWKFELGNRVRLLSPLQESSIQANYKKLCNILIYNILPLTILLVQLYENLTLCKP